MEPIDVVYTWVNGSDPLFLEQLMKYTNYANFKFKSDASNNRFEDYDQLRYSLRSIEMFSHGFKNWFHTIIGG